MKAIKNNKEYDINEAQAKTYLAEGYDIYDEGELVKRSPKSVVAYSEYEALEEEVEQTKSNAITALKNIAEKVGVDIGNASTIDGIVKKFNDYQVANSSEKA